MMFHVECAETQVLLILSSSSRSEDHSGFPSPDPESTSLMNSNIAYPSRAPGANPELPALYIRSYSLHNQPRRFEVGDILLFYQERNRSLERSWSSTGSTASR